MGDVGKSVLVLELETRDLGHGQSVGLSSLATGLGFRIAAKV